MKTWTTRGPGVAGAVALSTALLAAPLVSGPVGTGLQAQSLRGGVASMDRQNAQARAHDFTFLRTAEDIHRFVEAGYLIPVVETRHLVVHQVSFPYARPEVRVFVERLASQFHAACGERMVVTSLTRPVTTQPRNASSRSVHPTGMAVDIRRTNDLGCRRWIEATLLELEGAGVLEVIYERTPPHYHVALFPRPYERYLVRRTGNERIVAQSLADVAPLELRWVTHRVARGETLVGISDRYGTAVARIQAENGLRGNRILVGQELRIPVYGEASTRVAAGSASSNGDAGIVGTAGAEEVGSVGTAGGGEAAGSVSTERPVHTVVRGESLWTIARRYGVDETAIRAANGLTGTRIHPGQELVIPVDGAVPDRIRYEVRPGESLWVIARRHGTTVAEILRTNGIRESRIHPGQILEVPVSR